MIKLLRYLEYQEELIQDGYLTIYIYILWNLCLLYVCDLSFPCLYFEIQRDVVLSVTFVTSLIYERTSCFIFLDLIVLYLTLRRKLFTHIIRKD